MLLLQAGALRIPLPRKAWYPNLAVNRLTTDMPRRRMNSGTTDYKSGGRQALVETVADQASLRSCSTAVEASACSR
jgi:hypothetical protein